MEQTQEKPVADVTDEQLAELIARNSELQKVEMLDGGVQPDYIILAKNNTKALDPTNADLYIENLKVGDFFIQKDKVVLGRDLKVVPLMFLTVYNEKDGPGNDAKFLGKWTQEQAGRFPLAEGSYFDRQMPNGHILTPTNWVVVELSGHPEVKFAVVSYKSTGSRIWKAWKEDVRKRSGSSATLVYKLYPISCQNSKGKWLDIQFEYAGSLLEKSKAMAVHCLQKSNELRQMYSDNLLIESHGENECTALPPPQARPNGFEEDLKPAKPVEDAPKPAGNPKRTGNVNNPDDFEVDDYPAVSDDDLDDFGF